MHLNRGSSSPSLHGSPGNVTAVLCWHHVLANHFSSPILPCLNSLKLKLLTWVTEPVEIGV